jgi:hypothetical protein
MNIIKFKNGVGFSKFINIINTIFDDVVFKFKKNDKCIYINSMDGSHQIVIYAEIHERDKGKKIGFLDDNRDKEFNINSDLTKCLDINILNKMLKVGSANKKTILSFGDDNLKVIKKTIDKKLTRSTTQKTVYYVKDYEETPEAGSVVNHEISIKKEFIQDWFNEYVGNQSVIKFKADNEALYIIERIKGEKEAHKNYKNVFTIKREDTERFKSKNNAISMSRFSITYLTLIKNFVSQLESNQLINIYLGNNTNLGISTFFKNINANIKIYVSPRIYEHEVMGYEEE